VVVGQDCKSDSVAVGQGCSRGRVAVGQGCNSGKAAGGQGCSLGAAPRAGLQKGQGQNTVVKEQYTVCNRWRVISIM
jgi:hypothetical protein